MMDEPVGVDRDDLDVPAVEARVAAPVEPEVPERATGVSGPAIVAVAAVLLMAVGAIGPWAKGPLGSSLSGIDGSNDGWVVLVVALVAGLSTLGYWHQPRKGTGVVLLVCAAVNGYLTYNDRESVRELVTSDGTAGLVTVGWGLSLALVGAAVLALAGVAMLIRRDLTP